MIVDFTGYILSLEEGGAPPDHATYQMARELLRAEMVREMMRRGLWSAPPGYLGLPGGNHWTSELIDELVSDCYEELFIHRLRMLRNQLRVRDNINGLVTRCVRNFLHDLRRENDPLGYQLYDILNACLGRLRDGGILRYGSHDAGPRTGPSPRAHNASVCVFVTGTSTTAEMAQPATDVDLDPVVRRWNAELWPELLQAQGRARRRVLTRLDELVAGLPREGIEAFRFKDLIDPLKSDLRSRWRQELLAQAEHAAAHSDPQAALRFRDLRDCVRRQLEKHQTTDRNHLLALWQLLWSYAAGESAERVSDKADRADKPPSDLGLAKALGLTRHRIAKNKETLGRLIEICQRSLAATRAEVSIVTTLPGAYRQPGDGPALATAEEDSTVDPASRKEALRLATGRLHSTPDSRSENAGSSRSREARPGDVFVLPSADELLVEWVVIDVDHEAERLLIVAADDRSWIGSHDIAIADPTVAGLKAIRCMPHAWIDADRLDPKWLAGRLPPALLAQIQRQRAAASDASRGASPDELEVDEDSEYQRWLQEITRILHGFTESEPRTPVVLASSPGRSPRQLRRMVLAAMMLFTFGLGAWFGWDTHQRQERATLPVISEVSLALLRPQQVRGEPNLHEVAATTAFVHLVLPLAVSDNDATYSLRILAGERRVWESVDLRPSARAEIGVVISRQLLTDGEYVIQLLSAAAAEPVATYELQIRALATRAL